jgi:DNA-directed RNA polymerase beta subunit
MKIGDKFNKLTALRHERSDAKRSFWVFVCDCGTEKVLRTSEVKSGSTKSCGCYRNDPNASWRFSNRKDPGIAARNALISSYKRNAKVRGLAYSLTIEVFERLTKSDCKYCGQTPEQKIGNAPSLKRNGEYVYNGIDRIDNDIGYIETNCASCCKRCNHAKSGMTLDDWNNWIERLCQFRQAEKAKGDLAC